MKWSSVSNAGTCAPAPPGLISDHIWAAVARVRSSGGVWTFGLKRPGARRSMTAGMGSLLGLAALIAAVAVGLRMLQERAADRARPGATPATAIPIADYSDIDVAVRIQACRCGGRFIVRGEGPADVPGSLRVAHLECRRCEREQRLYFDMSTVRH